MDEISKKISAHVVLVEHGSGVLIQPMSEQYSYIFTAKHVLESDTAGKYLSPEEIRIERSSGELMHASRVLLDQIHDAAIIMIPKVEFATLARCAEDVSRDQVVYLAGYPHTRRKTEKGSDRLREYKGEVARFQDHRFTLSLSEMPSQDQIIGVSGGGVFKRGKNDIFLCGIEFKMEGNPNDEFHGRVECIPMYVFDNLIKSSPDNYSPFHPPYLKCFSSITDQIFQFDGAGTPQSLYFLQTLLQRCVEKLRENGLPQPIEIYERTRKSILIKNASADDALNIHLWISFLEFIVVASIIDGTEQVDFSYLQASSTKRKFLFSATKENWLMLLRDIFTSDLRGLKPGGTIVVSTGDFKGQHTPSVKTLENVVADIGRLYYQDLKIDAPIKNPVQEFKLHHWTGIHYECVVKKEDDYAKFNALDEVYGANALLEIIKEEYCAFIGKYEVN